jgi:hydrogenase expression/formation protein HypC
MSAACDSDHCVTCSDEGVPVRVIEAHEDGIAVCADEAGSSSEVMTDLVGAVAPGDELLVHAGVAIGRLE